MQVYIGLKTIYKINVPSLVWSASHYVKGCIVHNLTVEDTTFDVTGGGLTPLGTSGIAIRWLQADFDSMDKMRQEWYGRTAPLLQRLVLYILTDTDIKFSFEKTRLPYHNAPLR